MCRETRPKKQRSTNQNQFSFRHTEPTMTVSVLKFPNTVVPPECTLDPSLKNQTHQRTASGA